MTFEWFTANDDDKWGHLSIKNVNTSIKIWCSRTEAKNIIRHGMDFQKELIDKLIELEIYLKDKAKLNEKFN